MAPVMNLFAVLDKVEAVSNLLMQPAVIFFVRIKKIMRKGVLVGNLEANETNRG